MWNCIYFPHSKGKLSAMASGMSETIPAEERRAISGPRVFLYRERKAIFKGEGVSQLFSVTLRRSVVLRYLLSASGGGYRKENPQRIRKTGPSFFSSRGICFFRGKRIFAVFSYMDRKGKLSQIYGGRAWRRPVFFQCGSRRWSCPPGQRCLFTAFFPVHRISGLFKQLSASGNKILL